MGQGQQQGQSMQKDMFIGERELKRARERINELEDENEKLKQENVQLKQEHDRLQNH